MTFPPSANALAGALVLLAVTAIPDWAQDTPQPAVAAHIEEVMHSLSGGHSVSQVAISPDGKYLAWTEDGAIRLAPLDNLDKSRRVTAAASPIQSCVEDDLAWSPDSAALAFFSDCANPGEQTDLFLAPLDGGPPRRLTTLTGYVDSPAFSPDGTRIGFLYVEGATRPAGALAAMKPFAGVIGEEGIEVQRIALARTDAPQPAAPTLASPANLHVYEFDWSPDSQSLAYVAANPPGENNWWVAKLYTQKLESAPVAILDPVTVAGPLHGLQIAVPRWSPDGRTIAFIGGLMSDQGVTGGDLYVMPSTGGQPRSFAEERASVVWYHWDASQNIPDREGGEFIDLTELRDGSVHLVPALEVSAGASAMREAGGEDFDATIGDGTLEFAQSVARDGTAAFILASFSQPPEIWIGHGGKARPLTHFNDGIAPAWGKSASVQWTSDKFHVQGWLLLPRDFDPGKKYPLIVEVHGGPASAVVPRWGIGGPLSPQTLSALGYFVLLPNPRGSYGEGEAFTQANRKDFGYGDLRDILAGVDAVEAKYPIDPNRVGLDGWSYGGFMTMFAITQTHRFKAAVAGAGISDWLSYYGENSIDQWMIPYFGASVYDDPAVYARSSAINFIKQAETPTLVVVGDRDGECPAPQSFEFWHALRDRFVATQLVVYPDEGHGFVNPAHQRDVLERAVEWFSRYLPPGP
jgi:dipeptidyl aminopeptidase/acylaminoacyl peptidase